MGVDTLDMLVTGMCGAGAVMGTMGTLATCWARVWSVDTIQGPGLLTGHGGTLSSSCLLDFAALVFSTVVTGTVNVFCTFCATGVHFWGTVCTSFIVSSLVHTPLLSPACSLSLHILLPSCLTASSLFALLSSLILGEHQT
jgi:hypothetical protein